MLRDEIKKVAEKEHGNTIAIRRHLHSNPELSFVEHQTSAYIISLLEALGISCQRMSDTGVVGIIEGLERHFEEDFVALGARGSDGLVERLAVGCEGQ